VTRSADHERADTLAYLQRRLRGAEAVAARNVDFADEARVMVRQLELILREISQGLHEGEADVAAAIAAAEQSGEQA
jgi:hypothetical protein